MTATDQAVRAIRFDPETPVDTDNRTTTTEWYRDEHGRFRTGFWASEPGRIDIHYEKDELCTIIVGKVRLTDAAGSTSTYGPGETFLIPRGFKGVWETVEPTRKFYAVHRPD